MKRICSLIVLMIILIQVSPYAQMNTPSGSSGKDVPGGLATALGLSVNYYYGPADRNISKISDDWLNWHFEGMLGITLAKDKSGRRSVVAAFGTYGVNNKKTITRIIEDQDYMITSGTQSDANNFFELEAGVVIADVLRVSTGIGQQYFETQNLVSSGGVSRDKKFFKYHSTTLGLWFALGKVSWMVECHIASGKDFENTSITPSTGLLFRF